MYGHHDVSSNTNPKLFVARASNPIGACIHTTSGSNSLAYLQGGCLREGRIACADYLIGRDGTRWKICPSNHFPYHAGQSRLTYANRLYQGDQVSQLLIGVELEQMGEQACTYEQIDSLAELIVQEGIVWNWRWPYYLIGHYEIARPIGRRSDPQGFLWGDFMGRLFWYARRLQVPGLD